jgi:hypothetical protein
MLLLHFNGGIMKPIILDENKLVPVCDKCHRATCWFGVFMCNESRNAGMELKTIKELTELKLENPSYWSDIYMTITCGEKAPFGYKEE